MIALFYIILLHTQHGYTNNNFNDSCSLLPCKLIMKRFLSFDLITPRGEWAVPGGTARPGQPVGKSEQAPASSPSSKNQFNIVVSQ